MNLRGPELESLRRVAQAREQRLRHAAGNFTTYVETVARDNKGNPLQLAPHQFAWHQHIEYCWARGLFCGILAPRNHGKTTALIAPLASFMLGRDPNRRVKIISNEDAKAMQRVGETSKMIKSPTYRRIFPSVVKGGPWTKHMLYVNRPGSSPEPSLEARGVMSTGVGGRGDVLLFDDVVDQKNSAQAEQRRKVTDTIHETWILSLDQDGAGNSGFVLFIATRWHVADASADLMSRPGWCFLIQKVRSDLACLEQEVVGAGDDYPSIVRVK